MPDNLDPFDVEALERSLNDSATRVSTVWISFLIFSLYLLITVATVEHRQLLLAEPVKLPVLNIDLPLWGFSFVAPILFVILHAYVMLQMLLLARTAAAYNEAVRQAVTRDNISRDGEISLRQRLANTLFAQIFAGSSREREGWLGWLLKAMAWITLAIAPILILLMFQFSFLPFHGHLTTWTHRLLIGAELVGAFVLWPLVLDARRDFNWTERLMELKRVAGLPLWLFGLKAGRDWDRISLRRRALPLMSCLLFVLVSLSLLTFPGEPHVNLFTGYSWSSVQCERPVQHRFNFVDLRFDRLVLPHVNVIDQDKLEKLERATEKAGERPYQGERTRILRDRDLNCGDFSDYADLRRIDWAGSRLRNANLDHAWLKGASLASADLQGATMAFAQLQGASLESAHLQDASLANADLSGAFLIAAGLQNANLIGANLQGAVLNGASLKGATFVTPELEQAALGVFVGDDPLDSVARPPIQAAQLVGAELQGVDLNGALLQKANLTEANLRGASLRRANLKGALLRGADLRGSNLGRAELQGALLDGSNLWGASLEYARLQGASLIRAQLQGASLVGAHLEGVDLNGASLAGASLDRAKLAGASLDGAKLQATSLNDAELQGASLFMTELQGASLDGAQIQGASFDSALLSYARFSNVYVWRAKIMSCPSAEFRVSDHKPDPVIVKSVAGIDKAIPAAPDEIAKFIERSTTEISDNRRKEEASARMRSKLIVDPKKNDTAAIEKIGQAVKSCRPSHLGRSSTRSSTRIKWNSYESSFAMMTKLAAQWPAAWFAIGLRLTLFVATSQFCLPVPSSVRSAMNAQGQKTWTKNTRISSEIL